MTTPTHIWGRGMIKAASISADGQTLVVASSVGVIVLDPITLDTRRVIACARQLRRISLSDEGARVVAWSAKDYLKRLPALTRVWDTQTGELQDQEMRRPPAPTRSDWAVMSPDERWMATAGERGQIEVIGDSTIVIECGRAAFYTVGFNASGALVVVQPGSITLFDPATGEASLRQLWPQTWIESLRVDADGLVTAECRIEESGTKRAVVLTLREGRQVGEAQPRPASETDSQRLAREYPDLFNADGSLALPRDGAGIVDVPRGMLSALNASATNTATAKGGRVAVVVGTKTVVVRDAASAAVVSELEAVAPVRKIALDDTGSVLVAALELRGHPNATIQMWDLNTSEQLAHGAIHGWIVADLAFTPGGELLVSCSYDQTIRFWTPRPMKFVTEYVGHAGELHAVAVHPEGDFVVSGGTDGSIRWWPLPPDAP